MTPALGLALVASLALGAEPGEAISDAGYKPKIYQLDAPFAVVQDGETLLELDAGVVMPLEGFQTLDQEFVRLQTLEYEHKTNPDPMIWFAAGTAVGGIGTAVLLIGLWLAIK